MNGICIVSNAIKIEAICVGEIAMVVGPQTVILVTFNKSITFHPIITPRK